MQISYSFDFDKKALLETMSEFPNFDSFYRPFNKELEEALQPFIDKWLKGSKFQHTVIPPQRTHTLLQKMYRKHIFVPRRDAERRQQKEVERMAVINERVDLLKKNENLELDVDVISNPYSADLKSMKITLPIDKVIEYIQRDDFNNRHYEKILIFADDDKLLDFHVKNGNDDTGFEVKFTKESLYKIKPLVDKYYTSQEE